MSKLLPLRNFFFLTQFIFLVHYFPYTLFFIFFHFVIFYHFFPYLVYFSPISSFTTFFTTFSFSFHLIIISFFLSFSLLSFFLPFFLCPIIFFLSCNHTLYPLLFFIFQLFSKHFYPLVCSFFFLIFSFNHSFFLSIFPQSFISYFIFFCRLIFLI